jgi:hypothetical protein
VAQAHLAPSINKVYISLNGDMMDSFIDTVMLPVALCFGMPPTSLPLLLSHGTHCSSLMAHTAGLDAQCRACERAESVQSGLEQCLMHQQAMGSVQKGPLLYIPYLFINYFTPRVAQKRSAPAPPQGAPSARVLGQNFPLGSFTVPTGR